MTWARFGDDAPDHPKILAAGPLAGWLWFCGICYCNRYLTDGYLPAGAVRRLADVDDSEALADRLVAVGLWERTDGGFTIAELSPPIAAYRRRSSRRIRSALRRAWEAIAHRVRPLILARDGYQCQHCGATDGPLHVDHVIPLAWGGSNDPGNLQCLCRTCNIGKGDRWSG